MTDFNQKHNRAVWFDIPVADLDRASAFYASVLDIAVAKEHLGDTAFCVLDHHDGNGGCLIVQPEAIAPNGGILLYLNAEGRLRDAVAKAKAAGGRVVEDVQSMGPHGFRALVLDSEGNRIALHSRTDG